MREIDFNNALGPITSFVNTLDEQWQNDDHLWTILENKYGLWVKLGPFPEANAFVTDEEKYTLFLLTWG